MDEPTRAQQKQVARDLLGWEDYWRGGDYWRIGGEPAYFPAWNSPDFLWPLLKVLVERHNLDVMGQCVFADGLSKDSDDGFGHFSALAVWAAALAVIGEW